MSELIDIRDGITLITTYSKTIDGKHLFIYVGMCNNILTKWVVQSQYFLQILSSNTFYNSFYIRRQKTTDYR